MRDMAEYMQKRRIKIPIRLDGELLLINENELLQINKILLHRNEKDLLEMLQCNGNVLQINIKIGIFGEKMQFLGENPAQRGGGGFSFLNSINNLNGTVTQEVTKEKNKIKKEKVCENHSEGILRDFEIFWQSWPQSHRKTDKKTSLKRFIAAFKENKDLSFETIMKGLEWWKKSNSWQDKQYIPAPEVWLNKCRWLAAENAPDSKPSESLRTTYTAQQSHLPVAVEKTHSDTQLAALFKVEAM